MNVLNLLAAQPWVDRLGLALLNFLWQGAAIAAVYAMLRGALRRADPNARYAIACVALFALAVAPAATWIGSSPGVVHPLPLAQNHLAPVATVPASPQGSFTVFAMRSEGGLMPAVVFVWIAGAALFWLRLAGGWLLAARARRRSIRPGSREWQEALGRLSARLGVRRVVRLVVSPLGNTPAVSGWWKPVVFMPIGALAGMPAEQVEALLLHELAHVRRNDHLVNLLQNAAEALLFYHPAVWWVSGHIRLERELCCDDIAAKASGDVFVYASALAEFAEFRRVNARLAMAATGGRFRARIARLLGQAEPEFRIGPGAGLAAGAALLALAAFAVNAQSPASPAFPVASVKRNIEANPRRIGVQLQTGGRLSTHNASLRLLLQNAYRIQAFQIAGGPDWVNRDGYDIEAKPESAVDEAQARVMFQNLLLQRFRMTIHRETRELPEYALTLAKGGIKIEEPKDGSCAETAPAGPVPPGQPGPCGRVRIVMSAGGIELRGSKIPIPELVGILATVMGSPVVDRTGYRGNLEVNVPFTPDDTTAGLPGSGGRSAPDGPRIATDPNQPTIFAALEERLGLKLESTKGPVEVIVIDHVERPSEN
jgi:uncharacterized protein (TIGR03435 family)